MVAQLLYITHIDIVLYIAVVHVISPTINGRTFSSFEHSMAREVVSHPCLLSSIPQL